MTDIERDWCTLKNLVNRLTVRRSRGMASFYNLIRHKSILILKSHKKFRASFFRSLLIQF